jgi:mono/diheme cytochrome c family protein
MRSKKAIRRVFFLTCVSAIAFAACRQDMHNQPKYKPLRPAPFFEDARSARPPVDGTVARNQLREDVQFFTGKMANAQQGAPARPNENTPAGLNTQPQSYQGYVTDFPFPIALEDVNRGQQRFNIYCSVCHGLSGDGLGMIVRRGYRQPPSFHIDRLRQAPIGYFFDVMTNGFGAMPDYAAQITPEDRWKIVAYIRALQLSQQGTLADVPPDKRNELNNPAGQGERQGGEHQR